MARSATLVCRKIKLKNFNDPKAAGGCGVVPFLSAKDLFCQRVAPSASRDSTDPFVVLRGRGQIKEALRMRLVRSGNGHKKARIMRGLMGWSGDYFLVLTSGLSGLLRRLRECLGIGWRTNTGV